MKKALLAIVLLLTYSLPQIATGTTSNSFNQDKIQALLTELLKHKNQISEESSFGTTEIFFFNPVNGDNFVASTNESDAFTSRPMSPEEVSHSQRVLNRNSLYSQESFGHTILVINLCKDCVVAKVREITSSDEILRLVGSEEWLVALTFHEFMHAFDQKLWLPVYAKYSESSECSAKIQEGSAKLAEAKSFSLLTRGDFASVRSYIKLFESIADETSISFYIKPALILHDYEISTGSNFFRGLKVGHLNPCH